MKLRITTDAYQNIIKKIGSDIPEKGGLLIGKKGIVTDFIFDQNAQTTHSTYQLNIEYLNPLIKLYKRHGYKLLGVVHSHPFGSKELSGPDREYFSSQFKNFPHLDFMYTPIVFSAKQNEFEFFPYVFHKNGEIEIAELEIIPNNYKRYFSKPNKPILNPETIIKRKELLNKNKNQNNSKAQSDLEQNFIRITLNQPVILIFIYEFLLGLCLGIIPFSLFINLK